MHEPTSPRPRPSRAVLVVIGLSIAIYLPSLWGGFAWDDLYILGSARPIDRLSPLHAFTDASWMSFIDKPYYRPLVFLSHKLDIALHGYHPAGHHLTNLALFGLSTLLLGLLLHRLGLEAGAAALALWLFAIHPSHAQVVAWITGRHDLMAGCFGLAFLVLALEPLERPVPGWRRWAGAGCLLLALLSKEVALAFPAALVLAWLAAGRDRAGAGLPCRLPSGRDLLVIVGVPLVACGLLRAGCAGVGLAYPHDVGKWPDTYLLSTCVNLRLAGRYLAMLLLGIDYGPLAPSELLARHARSSGDLGARLAGEADLELACAVVSLVCLLPLALRTWRAGFTGRFGLLLVVLPVLLSMNHTNAYWNVAFADRYLHVPTMGLCILVGRWASSRAAAAGGSLGAALGRRGIAAVGVLSLCWVSATFDREACYADQLAFATAAVRKNPASPHAHLDLGLALRDAGHLDEAEARLRISWSILPLPDAGLALVQLALRKGRCDEALELAREPTLRIRSVYHLALLAQCAASKGRTAEGLAFVREAMALCPDDPGLRGLLALCLRALGRPGEAAAMMADQMRLSPGRPDAYNNLALLLVEQARPAEALGVLAAASVHQVRSPALRETAAKVAVAAAGMTGGGAIDLAAGHGPPGLRPALGRLPVSRSRR